MKQTQFNKGWWNCFESFAKEISFFNPSTAPTVCKNVLKAAGVTEREADDWLKRQEENATVDESVVDIVRKYLLSLR